MLLATWFDDPARPTRDLDLLGFGDPAPDAMRATFRDILSIEVNDGILFNADTLRVDRIREALDYGGVRLGAVADVGERVYRLRSTSDSGTRWGRGPNCSTTPRCSISLHRSCAYARETVIDETFQAMVAFGRANSRMKDF